MRNPTFTDTGSEWHLASGSVDQDGDGINEWPWASYHSATATTASMFITSSNPHDSDGQHIRINIPREYNSGAS